MHNRRFFCVSALCFIMVALGACSLRTATTLAVSTPTPPGGACMPAGATPPYQNVRVSHDTYSAHSEPMVAVNPKNPLDLVGGSKFFTDPKHYQFQIGYYSSQDGGCTWRDGGVLPGFTHEPITSDVTFAFDNHNAAYVAVLNTDNRNESGISVAKSTDGGQSFGQPVSVFDDTSGQVFSDKPWIGIDTTGGKHDGTIYVVWSYDVDVACTNPTQAPCTQNLGFAKSTDGGQTFSKAQLIEGSAPFCNYSAPGRPPTTRKCEGVLGATPAILPDGTIAVAYAYYDLSGQRPTKLLVVTSKDSGFTWSSPTLIATTHDTPGAFPPANFRNSTLPAFAADPTTDQLYIAWAEEQNHEANIVLSTSTDAGKTWSAPRKINDDPAGKGAIHIQPQLAVAPDGVVSVSFFDSRASLTPHLLDVYLAQSIDHAHSFMPDVRVTQQPFDTNTDEPKDSNGDGFIGDYQGLAATNQFVYPFWNDTRTGSQEIFTAAAPSAQP